MALAYRNRIELPVLASRLPLLPPAPMSRRATARSRARPELRTRLPRVGRLDHLAGAAERFFRQGAGGAEGQGFGAVHFVEMGFVAFGGGVGTGRADGFHPTPRACGARPSPSRRG